MLYNAGNATETQMCIGLLQALHCERACAHWSCSCVSITRFSKGVQFSRYLLIVLFRPIDTELSIRTSAPYTGQTSSEVAL